MGDDSFGINSSVVKSFANQIHEVVKLGIQLCIVVGGGNIYRGISNTKNGILASSSNAWRYVNLTTFVVLINSTMNWP